MLARNARLYPFHKWLLRETERAPERPAMLLDDIDGLLREPSQLRVERLVADVLGGYGIDEAATNETWPSLYMQDVELAWMGGRPAIDDLEPDQPSRFSARMAASWSHSTRNASWPLVRPHSR